MQACYKLRRVIANVMSLQIGSALRDGFDRTVSANGLLLMSVFLVFGAGNVIVSQSTSLAITEYLRQFSV